MNAENNSKNKKTKSTKTNKNKAREDAQASSTELSSNESLDSSRGHEETGELGSSEAPARASDSRESQPNSGAPSAAAGSSGGSKTSSNSNSAGTRAAKGKDLKNKILLFLLFFIMGLVYYFKSTLTQDANYLKERGDSIETSKFHHESNIGSAGAGEDSSAQNDKSKEQNASQGSSEHSTDYDNSQISEGDVLKDTAKQFSPLLPGPRGIRPDNQYRDGREKSADDSSEEGDKIDKDKSSTDNTGEQAESKISKEPESVQESESSETSKSKGKDSHQSSNSKGGAAEEQDPHNSGASEDSAKSEVNPPKELNLQLLYKYSEIISELYAAKYKLLEEKSIKQELEDLRQKLGFYQTAREEIEALIEFENKFNYKPRRSPVEFNSNWLGNLISSFVTVYKVNSNFGDIKLQRDLALNNLENLIKLVETRGFVRELYKYEENND